MENVEPSDEEVSGPSESSDISYEMRCFLRVLRFASIAIANFSEETASDEGDFFGCGFGENDASIFEAVVGERGV